VDPGPTFNFDWLRLVRQPVNGLAVTRADGSPIGDAVTAGDTLRFELHLEEPAKDAIVETFVGHRYERVAINGQPYLQLRRAEESGCVWIGQVTIGPETEKESLATEPVVFRAAIAGGAITETYASAAVSFK
jgi:hypothetical protein